MPLSLLRLPACVPVWLYLWSASRPPLCNIYFGGEYDIYPRRLRKGGKEVNGNKCSVCWHIVGGGATYTAVALGKGFGLRFVRLRSQALN